MDSEILKKNTLPNRRRAYFSKSTVKDAHGLIHCVPPRSPLLGGIETKTRRWIKIPGSVHTLSKLRALSSFRGHTDAEVNE